ncbi:hypothetical protein IP78_08775 [Brevundimonas sp. AAP58]|nr:hypothetical protein IP78_08775 [Brevundimonas sp. AAP58]
MEDQFEHGEIACARRRSRGLSKSVEIESNVTGLGVADSAPLDPFETQDVEVESGFVMIILPAIITAWTVASRHPVFSQMADYSIASEAGPKVETP